MKYLRDFKQTFTARSIILTTLLGGRVNFANLLGDRGYYADVPTTLVHIVSDLDAYLQANPYMPVIHDPGGTGEDFSHRWDQAQYENFRSRINRYSELMSEAFDEPDAEKSERAWQRIFGPNFTAPRIENAPICSRRPRPPHGSSSSTVISGFHTSPTDIACESSGGSPKQGFRTYDLPKQGNRVTKGRHLTFRIAQCDVPSPYEIYWKVRNRGADAANLQALRGEITQGGDTKSNGPCIAVVTGSSATS